VEVYVSVQLLPADGAVSVPPEALGVLTQSWLDPSPTSLRVAVMLAVPEIQPAGGATDVTWGGKTSLIVSCA
jgi:hypothetical protein